GVFTLVESGRQLEVAVLDVHARVSDGGRPSAIPDVIQIGGDADVLQCLPGDRRSQIARIPLGAHIDGRVVEIVLYALAVNHLQSEDVVGRRLHVRAEADPPSPDVAAEIELILEAVVPREVSKRAADLDVAPATTHAVMPGEIGGGEPAEDVRQLDPVGQ